MDGAHDERKKDYHFPLSLTPIEEAEAKKKQKTVAVVLSAKTRDLVLLSTAVDYTVYTVQPPPIKRPAAVLINYDDDDDNDDDEENLHLQLSIKLNEG
jgi:hypothetical protein